MKARLGDVCTVVSGSTPKSTVPEYWDGDIKWITPAELSNDTYIINDSARHITALGVAKTGLKSFPAGTVILSSRAPIGKTAIAGCEMFCNQGFKNLICSEKIDSKYLYYFLSGKTDYLNSLGRGATFKEISKAIVENIEIPLPEVEEQKRIAARFEWLLRLIQLQKAELEELDKLVKSRFIELFGDPVSNSMGLPTEPMTTICAIIDGDRGKNYPKQDEFSDTGYCLFLNAKNVTATGFSFENRMFITKEKDDALHNGKLERGDVVLTTRGTLGNLAFYDDSVPFENVRINSGMVILRMKKSVMTEVFFMEQFKLQLQSIKGKIASGSAQPQLPISTMNKIRILLAPMALQEQFAAFVEQTDKSKYYSSLSFRYCQAAANTYRQEWMTCRTSDF